MNVDMRRGKLLVPALAAALALAGCGGVDRRHYVAANDALLESLPVFPGATKIHEVSTPYVRRRGWHSRRVGGNGVNFTRGVRSWP
jgi:hypothetical protein